MASVECGGAFCGVYRSEDGNWAVGGDVDVAEGHDFSFMEREVDVD